MIRKVLLLVSGYEGNILMDEIPEENNPVVRGARTFKYTAFLIAQVVFPIIFSFFY